MQSVIIPVELATRIVSYLQEQPWKHVASLLADIHAAGQQSMLEQARSETSEEK